LGRVGDVGINVMSPVQNFIKVYRNAGVPRSLRGYTNQEAKGLESQYGVKLPPAFVAYLKLMGHDTDWLFLGTDASLHHLKQLRKWADNLLVHNGKPFELYPQDFVFLMHQGYQFMWFRADGSSEDPPVFYYLEGNRTPEQKFDTFSAYLLFCISEIQQPPAPPSR
jgi:hypothetical protein